MISKSENYTHRTKVVYIFHDFKKEKKNPLCIHLWSKQVYTFLNNQDRHEKQREKQESEDDSSFQVSVITPSHLYINGVRVINYS